MKTTTYIMAVALSTIVITGCKKDFLDINQNPNAPERVDIKDVLPSAELAIGHVIGNNFQIYGCLWAGYWTQNPYSSQYKTIEQYSPAASDFDSPWRLCYSDALADLSFVVKKGTELNKMQYVACAKILQAYTFQILTDNFGDIPFSEALQGESGILAPKYDAQKDVYDGIIKLLNDGIALIDVNATNGPTTNDLLLGGDMAMWKKFANTLKLRVYLRMAYVDPAKASLGVGSLSGVSFLGEINDVVKDVKIKYTTSPGGTNPLYSVFSETSNTQNLVASQNCLYAMYSGPTIDSSDFRMTVFYDTIPGPDYDAIKQGFYTSSVPVSKISLPHPNTGANSLKASSAAAPVKLMSDYESLFLQAEAVARGWMAGNAKTLYEDGIKANYFAYGLSTTQYNLYMAGPYTKPAYPTAGTIANQIEAIITQKYYSMCGNQGNEAWVEFRRTGFPSFMLPSVKSIIGLGKWPNRMFYPSTELTRNPNVPSQHLIYGKVWWDVN